MPFSTVTNAPRLTKKKALQCSPPTKSHRGFTLFGLIIMIERSEGTATEILLIEAPRIFKTKIQEYTWKLDCETIDVRVKKYNESKK